MKAWIDHNLHSLNFATGRLLAAPLATLFSTLVIGIALSLPLGLYILLLNADHAAGPWRDGPDMSVFLAMEISDATARQLAEDLERRPDIAATRFIHRDEGLETLRAGSGMDIAAGLRDNPLPHAISLTPEPGAPERLEALAAELRALDAVERVSVDADWARRLSALLRFGQDLVWMLAILLGFAMAAITGNTIRLQIYALRDEIEVSRLIGATDRFIRRPFLYFGALQGLLGGLAAWGLVSAGLGVLDDSVARLAQTYASEFSLIRLGPVEVAALLATSTLLGFLGAFLAVAHSLRRLA